MSDGQRTESACAKSSARQNWDADRYARDARFVADLGGPVIDLLGPVSGLRILDLGCGDGALTERIVAAGAEVVAVDASASQVAAARARGLDARVADARSLDFEGEGNVQIVRRALISSLNRRGHDGDAADPWFFPSEDTYQSLLEASGFSVESVALIPRPTPIPGDIGDWIETLAGSFLAVVPEDERNVVKADVRDAARALQRQTDGRWSVDYVRLRFAAHLN